MLVTCTSTMLVEAVLKTLSWREKRWCDLECLTMYDDFFSRTYHDLLGLDFDLLDLSIPFILLFIVILSFLNQVNKQAL